MFIDIHVHAKAFPAPRDTEGSQFFSTPEQLIERYDSMGVEKAVLLPGVSPDSLPVQTSNEEILNIAERFPGRFIPFCNIDPRAISNSPDASLGYIIKQYKDMGCRGIGEVTANMPFLDPMVKNLFRHAEEAGMPLTFHIGAQIGNAYGLFDEPGLPGLERSLMSFPRLKFFGHSQAFWAEIGRLKTPADRYGYPDYPVDEEGAVPIIMRRHENLYGDLSARSGFNALKRDREYGIRFINEFQDRLLFGTDICRPNPPAPLAEYLLELKKAGDIKDDVFKKIARENAIRILGL